jgi:vitamin B12 transporter
MSRTELRSPLCVGRPLAPRRLNALLLCGALCLSAVSAASAQGGRLEPVVIVGSREPLSPERLVADVVVIDAERIRASSADSVEDLLRRESGIALSRAGGPGQGAGVMLRGASAANTVVLIDGVRIGSATLGQTDLAALSLAQIERIEVLRGPGSSLYGADAVGGVVLIFTRRGSGAPALNARLARGGLGSSEAELALSGAQAGFDYAASISREASDGISAIAARDANGYHNPDRDGYSRRSAQWRLGWSPASGHRIGASMVDSRLHSKYDSAEFEPPTFTADPSGDYRSRLHARSASFDYRGTLAPQWTTTLQLSQQRDDAASGALVVSRYQTRRSQLTWQNALNLAPGQQLVAAFEHQAQRIEAPYDAPRQRDNALVLGYAGGVGPLRLQFDLRHDNNSAWGGVNTGKLGAAFDFAPGATLRAVAGTAFRAPSFNELYFPGFGVATLNPERSRSIEFGVKWRDDDGSAALTLFRNRVRELIAYEPDRSFCPADPSFDFGCARNVNRATLQGASIEASRRFGAVSLRGHVDFLDARDATTRERLPRRASHQAGGSVEWTQDALTLAATVLGVGQRRDGATDLAPYDTADLQARWRLARQWQLEARLLNAFDRQYQTVRDYPGLPRQAWIGLRYAGGGL